MRQKRVFGAYRIDALSFESINETSRQVFLPENLIFYAESIYWNLNFDAIMKTIFTQA